LFCENCFLADVIQRENCHLDDTLTMSYDFIHYPL